MRPGAGWRNQRVAILKRSEDLDEFGQRSTQFTVHREFYASMKPVAGRESASTGQLRALQTYLVIVPYVDGLDKTMILQWGDERLNILSITDRDMRRQFLTLECAESDGSSF
jgi:SPP1 family predicted phage head-tail adaptor